MAQTVSTTSPSLSTNPTNVSDTGVVLDTKVDKTNKRQWKNKNKRNDSRRSEDYVLIVKFLPPAMTSQGLYELFSAHGELESCKVATNKNSGASLGYGFVRFKKERSATEAMRDLNGTFIQGKVLKVNFLDKAKKAPADASANTPETAKSNIYIAGLPHLWTSADLAHFFSRFGAILKCKVLVDSYGESRNIGFVQYISVESAVCAIKEVNGTVLPGAEENVIVKYARDTISIRDDANPTSKVYPPHMAHTHSHPHAHTHGHGPHGPHGGHPHPSHPHAHPHTHIHGHGHGHGHGPHAHPHPHPSHPHAAPHHAHTHLPEHLSASASHSHSHPTPRVYTTHPLYAPNISMNPAAGNPAYIHDTLTPHATHLTMSNSSSSTSHPYTAAYPYSTATTATTNSAAQPPYTSNMNYLNNNAYMTAPSTAQPSSASTSTNPSNGNTNAVNTTTASTTSGSPNDTTNGSSTSGTATGPGASTNPRYVHPHPHAHTHAAPPTGAATTSASPNINTTGTDTHAPAGATSSSTYKLPGGSIPSQTQAPGYKPHPASHHHHHHQRPHGHGHGHGHPANYQHTNPTGANPNTSSNSTGSAVPNTNTTNNNANPNTTTNTVNVNTSRPGSNTNRATTSATTTGPVATTTTTTTSGTTGTGTGTSGNTNPTGLDSRTNSSDKKTPYEAENKYDTESTLGGYNTLKDVVLTDMKFYDNSGITSYPMYTTSTSSHLYSQTMEYPLPIDVNYNTMHKEQK